MTQSSDRTQDQDDFQRDAAQQMSMRRQRPPLELPGYSIERFLGSGAYGEVWVGIDQNTGRQVAIKVYSHRGGVDWSLLSREVEKLVYLSADRYVVQLLVVGWDANPPYYVMEYIANGSLDEHLRTRGTLPLDEALDLFREVAIGLSHAHAKGVLHCDLKPGNILLDQDHKPRLADFGQSRLSHEQSPSLGTLFYMAPEQAGLDAVPDARWDVYALGALLYCTLVGAPPHRSEEALRRIDTAGDLEERLSLYRRLIREAPLPTGHRQVRGMDSALATIIDRCLVANPERRLSTVQAVLQALDEREQARHRRPLVVMGLVGPLLLLAIMLLFGWRSYVNVKTGREREVMQRAAEVNYFAAKTVAAKAAEELDRYYNAVREAAADPELLREVADLTSDSQIAQYLSVLKDPTQNDQSLPERAAFLEAPGRQALDRHMMRLLEQRPAGASWFVTDRLGTQLASAFAEPTAVNTAGQNYAWRTYFHGGQTDLADDGHPRPIPADDREHIQVTTISAPFRSKATRNWKVAIATPLMRDGLFLGVVAMTVDIRVFLRFEEGSLDFFAVLVDGRVGDGQGLILQHPAFDRADAGPAVQGGLAKYYVPLIAGEGREASQLLEDPVPGETPADRPWLAAQARVVSATAGDTGFVVQVQQDYASLVDPVRALGREFLRLGAGALIAVVLVVVALWAIVLRAVATPAGGRLRPPDKTLAPLTHTPAIHQQVTVEQPKTTRD